MTAIDECDAFLFRVGWATPECDVTNPIQLLRDLRKQIEEHEIEASAQSERARRLEAKLTDRDDEIAGLKRKLAAIVRAVDDAHEAAR